MTVLELHPTSRTVTGNAIRLLLAGLAGLSAGAGLMAVIGAGFALSFDAIRAVAIAASVRPSLAWLLSAAVDGAMAVGTVAAVVVRRLGQPAIYPWSVVLINAGISIFCNALHAYMGQSMALPPAIAMAVSAIPAVNLALAVHLLVLLIDAVVTLLRDRLDGSDIPHINDQQEAGGAHHPQTKRTRSSDQPSRPSRKQAKPAVSLDKARRSRELRREAWRWAVTYRRQHGVLPSGRVLAERYGRRERWGRLVKTSGLAGEYGEDPIAAATGS